MKTISIAALVLFSTYSWSETIELLPSKDNTVYETQAEPLSNGSGDYLFCGRTLQSDGLQFRRGLLQFDLSQIPDNALIESANLELTISRFRATGTVSIHKAESAWGEGTSNANGEEGSGTTATLNDATWINAFNGDENSSGTPWNQVGGDFANSATASDSFTNLGVLNFSSTTMTQDIQDWVTGSSINMGWFIIGNETAPGTAVRFNSRENSTNPPKLTITYSLPYQSSFVADKDNTLYETNDGSLSNGSGNEIYFGKTGNNGGNALRRALMRFDLSSIPSTATIINASVDVQVTAASNNAQNMNAELRMLTADWGEGTSSGGGSGAASTTGDATWLHTFYDTLTWNTMGGDFSANVSASAAFTTSNTEMITFDSNIEMVADVQTWVNDSNINFGWMLLGDEINNSNTRGIGSSESQSPPLLHITYTVPDLIFMDDFE